MRTKRVRGRRSSARFRAVWGRAEGPAVAVQRAIFALPASVTGRASVLSTSMGLAGQSAPVVVQRRRPLGRRREGIVNLRGGAHDVHHPSEGYF